MGGTFSWLGSLWQNFGGNGQAKLLITGLDAAGKTSVLYRMKIGSLVTSIPTIGFNLETFEHQGLTIQSWDIGGRDKIRPLWRMYIEDLEALIYVIDSNDRERISEARAELLERMSEPRIAHIPVMVLANKQDLPGVMSVEEMRAALGVERVMGRWFRIQPVSALSGDGLKEAFDWLSDAVKKTRAGTLPGPMDAPPTPAGAATAPSPPPAAATPAPTTTAPLPLSATATPAAVTAGATAPPADATAFTLAGR